MPDYDPKDSPFAGLSDDALHSVGTLCNMFPELDPLYVASEAMKVVRMTPTAGSSEPVSVTLGPSPAWSSFGANKYVLDKNDISTLTVSHPPSVTVKVRQSGSVVVTVNLSRGGFTCFLKPPVHHESSEWHFGFAFRCPTDAPSSIGKDTAFRRCGQFYNGTKRSCFAGTVEPPMGDTVTLSSSRPILVIRALRSLRKSGALTNVRWWTKDSMDQAVALLREGPKEESKPGDYYFKVAYVNEKGEQCEPTEPPAETK